MSDTLTTEWWRAGGPGPATARGEPLFGVTPTAEQIAAARVILAQSLAAHRLMPIIDAVKELGADGSDASTVTIATLPSGNISIRIIATSEGAAISLSEKLGCPTPERATNGRHAWLSSELGDFGDPIQLSVTGGHRPVCQCHLDGIPQNEPDPPETIELGVDP